MISLCPAVIGLSVYFNKLRRLGELAAIQKEINAVRQSVTIKNGCIPTLSSKYGFLNINERKMLEQFLSQCSTSNSDVILCASDNLIEYFKRCYEEENADFSKRGKVTAVSGICIGLVMFILAI